LEDMRISNIKRRRRDNLESPPVPQAPPPESKEEKDEKTTGSIRDEVMRSLEWMEREVDAEKAPHTRAKLTPEEYKRIWDEGVPTLPAGFKVSSEDGKLAQEGRSAAVGFGLILFFDEATKMWKRAVTGTYLSGPTTAHMFVNHAVKDGQGIHYDWNEQRLQWVHTANPPIPPPEGASLSSSLPGFANGYLGDTFVYYQWIEDERKWILVGPVPSGFVEAANGRRLEAADLDDWHIRIYWDGERRSWVDPRTGKPPVPRPLPPAPAVVGEETGGDLAKVDGKEIYYLWNKARRRWVLLHDLPPGFHRGDDPKEAYQTNGSAFDRWIEWDNTREAWVDFDPGRRLNIRGRIQ
jgi:hypothetical protein